MQKKKEILKRANNKPNYSITHDMTNIYTEAFSIFFKIGAFTIGGGYAMVPLIEDEIVTKRRWIAKEDFIDLLAIAQSAPGIVSQLRIRPVSPAARRASASSMVATPIHSLPASRAARSKGLRTLTPPHNK